MAQSPANMADEPSEQQEPGPVSRDPSHRDKSRSKSRASTSSLQSVGVGSAFQPAQQQHAHDPTMPLDHNPYFLAHGGHPPQTMYPTHADDLLIQYPPHGVAAHMHQQGIDPATGLPHVARPLSQHGFHDMQYQMQYPPAMPTYPVGHQHMQHMQHVRHHSEQFEGSPAPEDSNNENGGAKRRKGAASSMANDQELRRLLAQYQRKTLKDVAIEVQKNEGGGGKSEKAKQVFAMLW
jgi:regulatory factor X, other